MTIKIKSLLAIALIVGAAAFCSFLISDRAYAEGAAGSGGSGGGCTPNVPGVYGCEHSDNAWGWFKLSVNGVGPTRNGKWSEAVATCQPIANSVVAYVVFDPRIDWAWASIFNYDGIPDKESTNIGDSNEATARELYNALTESERRGTVWGSRTNGVGWVCADFKEKNTWSLNAQSYILRQGASSCTPATKTQASFIDAGSAAQPSSPITAYPGDCLLWRHAIRATNGVVTSDITHALYGSGFRSSVIPIISDPRPYLIERSTTKQPVGNDALVTCRAYVTDSGCTTPQYTRYNVTAEDAGKTLCQWIAYTPISSSNGDRAETDKRCATIPYTWSVTTKAEVDSAKTATVLEPGDSVYWKHTVTNNGPNATTDTGRYVLSRYDNVNNTGSVNWNDGSTENVAGPIFARTVSSRVCVDVPSGGTADATQLQLYGCNDNAAQLWVLESDGSGGSRIRNPNSNKCLDVPGGVTSNGTRVAIHTCNSSAAQKWTYDASTGLIRYPRGNQCLDRSGGGTTNGTWLIIYTCSASNNNQLWTMSKGGTTASAYGMDSTDGLASGATRSFESSYKVLQSDVGKTLCRRTLASAKAWNSLDWTFSAPACVTIPYNFALVPDVSIGSKSVEVGTDQTVTGTVKNNGPTRSTASVTYRLTKFVYGPTASPSTASISNTTSDACAAFAGGPTRVSCAAVDDASGTVAAGYAYDGSGSYSSTFTVDDLAVGTKICFVMSVTPNTHSAGSAWRHSAMKCHVIGKKPKVQVWGGDVLVRQRGTLAGDIATNITSQKDGTPQIPTSSPGLVCPTAYIAPTHEAIPRATADFDLYPRTAFCGGSLDKKFVVAGDKFDIVAQVHNAGTTKSPDGSSLGEHIPYTLYAYNVKTTAAATMEPGLTANFKETVPANLQGDIGKVQYAEKDFANTDPGGCDWLASILGGTSAQCRVTAYNSNNKRIQFDVFTSNKNNLISGHYAPGAGTSGRLTLDTTGYVPGDRVCYFLAIRRFDVAHNFMTTARDSTNLTRRVSKPVCVDIISSAPTATVNNYGSWGEYALVSPGEVRNMASGSGFQGGSVSNNICGTGSLSLLTFNNWDTTSALCPPGKYITGTTSPAVGLAKYFNEQSYQSLTSDTIDPENVASSPGVYRPAATAGGTITLQAATGTTSTIRVGKWAVLYAPGKVVNINSDIRYQNSGISSARNIPQLVIIANQIRIASTVKNVDAWLVARRDGAKPAMVHTCGSNNTPNATQCNDRLRVNGPVITEQLLLKRTAGGGVAAQAGEPAEVFNARPDAYLWFIETFGGGQRLPTASTTELPPRF